MMKIERSIFATVILIILILFGCSDKLVETPGELLQLKIGVEGITASVENISTITSQRSANTWENNSSTFSGDESGFITSLTTIQDGLIGASNEDSSDSYKIQNPIKKTINRAVIDMQEGYTYRVLIYNRNTGEFWRTIQARSGTPATVEGQRGVTYTWYAYSYNNMDEIPAPANVLNPLIETPIDKSLMYATGEITIPTTGQAEANIIGILFEHKVAQLRIKIDATSLATYATINNLNATFDNSSYIKKGQFNIRENRISQIEVVPTETIFNTRSTTNIWDRSFFTVDAQVLSTYKIFINDLPVTFTGVPEALANRNLATYFGAVNRPAFTSSFRNPVIGQRLTSNIFLNYQPSSLRVLHISSGSSDGFALEQGPSWQFINSKENFGDLPQSVVKIGSWTAGGGAWEGGTATANSAQNRMTFSTSSAFDNQIRTRLAAGAPNRPDIVIIGFNVSSISTIFGTALNDFINDRGIVVMMLQSVSNNDQTSANFFNNLFGVNNIGFFNNTGASGAMYPIDGNNPTDVILNGPFGDVRNQFWGDDRGPSTLGIVNAPANQITIYSREQAINRAAAGTSGATMFIHNTKSLFFVGDGGFVAYSAGGANNMTAYPFLYDANTTRPLPKPFGNSSNGYVAGSRNAYNSIIMANVMAWAVRKAELEGVRPWKYAAPPTP
ncbi:hypothetical protein [Sphingobacterium corticibacter]|nr:hypothetical protein [Sphingobacterium corticibacter]